MRRETYVAASALFALLVLSGCPQTREIALTAETGPPPGKLARLIHDDYEPVEYSVTMSKGVVMTVDCWDSCDYYCKTITITPDDSSVVAIRPVFRLGGATTEHLLLAGEPGTTRLTVSNACATQSYDVTVLAD